MPNIFVSKETLSKLHMFIERSRVSAEFGAEKRLKSFDDATAMLLDFALRYHYDDFERLAKIPSFLGEMKAETFDNEELRNQIISDKIQELENDV